MIHGMSQFHSLLLSTFFSDISAYTMSLSSFSSFLFSLFFFLFFSPPTQTIVKKISRTCVHVSLPITRPMKRSYRGRYRSLSFSLISLRTDYVDTSFILVATFAAIIEELTSRGLNIPVIVLNRSTEESPRAASAVSERGRKSNRERERERERGYRVEGQTRKTRHVFSARRAMYTAPAFETRRCRSLVRCDDCSPSVSATYIFSLRFRFAYPPVNRPSASSVACSSRFSPREISRLARAVCLSPRRVILESHL